MTDTVRETPLVAVANRAVTLAIGEYADAWREAERDGGDGDNTHAPYDRLLRAIDDHVLAILGSAPRGDCGSCPLVHGASVDCVLGCTAPLGQIWAENARLRSELARLTGPREPDFTKIRSAFQAVEDQFGAFTDGGDAMLEDEWDTLRAFIGTAETREPTPEAVRAAREAFPPDYGSPTTGELSAILRAFLQVQFPSREPSPAAHQREEV